MTLGVPPPPLFPLVPRDFRAWVQLLPQERAASHTPQIAPADELISGNFFGKRACPLPRGSWTGPQVKGANLLICHQREPFSG